MNRARAHLSPGPRAGRERDLEPDGDPGCDPHRQAREDRRRAHDSPPTSVHLVGAAVRRATGARWIADLRDSIVANPHRRTESALVRAKERNGESVARLVARKADAVVAVSDPIAEELRALGAARVETISNGCDFEDFAGLEYTRSPRLRITHTGSFFGRRSPRPILEALAGSDVDAVLRFVGDFRAADREFAESLGLGDRLELHPICLPRREVLAIQKDSGGAAAPDPGVRRPRPGRAVGQGVRVPRRRAADPGGGPAGRRRGRPSARDRRRNRGRARRRRGPPPRSSAWTPTTAAAA